MPVTDYVPHFGEGNLSTRFRNVLGVPIRKRIVVAVIAVFGLFLIFVCGLLLANSEHRPTFKHVSHPLYVPLTRSMNVSVDPCTDFYEFTCGHWSKNEEVSKSTDHRITSFELLQTYFDEKKRKIFENSQTSSNLPRVVNDAITFFKICNSEKRDHQLDLSYLENYLKEVLGGWPAAHPGEWNDSDFDWIQASALLMKTLGIATVMDVFSTVDDHNSSRRILYLKPPEIKGVDYAHNEASTNMVYVILLALKSDISNVSDIIDNIMSAEKQWWQTFRDVPETNRTRTTFKELTEMLPDFDWMFYLRTIMNDTLKTLDTDISDEDVILIDNFKGIEKIISFFRSGNLSKVEIANLFGWFVARKTWFLIPGVFEKHAIMFGYDLDESTEGRKNLCFDFLLQLYESSVDYLFVKNSSQTCLPDGKVIVHYLKNALRNSLDSSDWLDDSTKELAILKLDYMQSVIGFRSYLNNRTEFDAIFNKYPPLTSPLQTYFETNAYFVSCVISTVMASDKPIYIMPRSVTHVSAYYDAQRNMFTLPLSMYHRPFYYSEGPWYLNFGAIGAVVGHEIMHGFDRFGCLRGETGIYKNWWSTNASALYEKRSECFTEQYSSYLNFYSSHLDVSHRSYKMLDEDIGDSEGLRLAYLAYKQWTEDNGREQMYTIFKQDYSAEQMFFISFGSVWCSKIDPQFKFQRIRHSFPKWRVNGAVSNSEYFSNAFHCPKGSAMNPDKKCLIW